MALGSRRNVCPKPRHRSHDTVYGQQLVNTSLAGRPCWAQFRQYGGRRSRGDDGPWSWPGCGSWVLPGTNCVPGHPVATERATAAETDDTTAVDGWGAAENRALRASAGSHDRARAWYLP